MDMDLSLLPVLSLLMVMSALKYFVDAMFSHENATRVLNDLDSKEGSEKHGEMAIVQPASNSIGGAYLFISAIILILIGDIPEWIGWMFWAILILNILAFLISSFENDPSKHGAPSSTLLRWFGFVQIAVIPIVIVLFGYTVYAAWTLT